MTDATDNAGKADVERTNNEALAHLLAFAAAAESVLRDFGDEYQGRLAPLFDVSEAYGIWLTTDSAPPAAHSSSQAEAAAAFVAEREKLAENIRRDALAGAEGRIRDLWDSQGWCVCRYSDGLERVVAALKGTADR